jgi:putative transposase
VPHHGPLLPPGLDGQLLTRRFLPWVERTVKAYGVEIDCHRYWHASMAPHIGQKIMVHRDARSIREVYPEIDGAFVVAPVVGECPDISEFEWSRARKEMRKAGKAFQEGGAQAETARLIHANHMEVTTAKARTREARQARKRQEREGVSHARQPALEGPRQQGTWVSTAELGEVTWLKSQ